MPRKDPKTSRTGSALLVGLAAALVVAACHLAGIDTRAELLTLDFRFRHLSGAPSSRDLVIVEIDDRSLEQYGRWPWPRELTAGIVEILHECGASSVALDIIMPEPQRTRWVDPAADIYDPDSAPLIGAGGPRPVFDDALLEDVLRRRRVLLPLHIEFGGTRGGGRESIDRRVGSILRADPQAPLSAVLREVLPDEPPGMRTPAAARVERAYLRHRGLASLKRFAIPAGRVEGYPAREGLLFPPLVRFAAVCHRSGFVSFPREFDGVMRRIPLLARSAGDVYPQFAFAMAADRLADGNDPAAISADAAHVVLRAPGAVVRTIPVDGKGNLLINWTAPDEGFRRISVGAVAYVWRQRQRQDKNRRLARLIALDAARQLKQVDLLGRFQQADAHDRKRIDYEINRQRAALYDPSGAPPPTRVDPTAEKRIEQQIDQGIRDMFDSLDFYLQSLPSGDPRRSAIGKAAARHARLAAANEQLQRDIDENLARIRQRVAGRGCIVGSTATGAADFVPTPVEARMPGVLVHANILNTISSGAFVTEAHPAVNVLAIFLAGALVSLLCARLPVLQAGPLAVLLAAGYAALNVVVFFGRLNYWLALVAPVAAIVASLLLVTAYRQLTEERARRHIRRLFAHAMSPALVDRLIADPSLARLGGEKRVLSCFFSDLSSFTPLAARLGEQDTVRLLNRYFDRMTDVIQNRCGGYLNKFLGDGILGFFGAPVVQADHARRAVEAAIACQDEVRRLNDSLAGEFDQGVTLSCRIGIATGPVMVGNCGSTERMDYTAIGDCVNLASRLESANKQFGTKILVDENAWRGGDGASLLARPMGRLLLVGVAEPVGVWNVLGPREEAPSDLTAAAGRFARAVELFAQRRFAEAAEAFQDLLDELPGDKASELYLALCRQYAASPPAEDWQPVVQLTEK